MNTTYLRKFLVSLALLFILAGLSSANAQEILTLDKALQIAETGSPDLQRSMLNLERFSKNLEAQRAALKSRFSLDVAPIEYSNTRRFDQRYSQWYTNETFESNSTFRIEQPILATDGTLSLINRFGWQNSNSEFEGVLSENKSFTNNLYLNLSQPIFTYNRRKLELKELELSFEDANINSAMQRLNLERTVTQYFYNVYMAQMNLSIAKDELANTQKSHDIIKNKVDAGLAAKEELYQSELNLSTSKSTLQNREVDLENAKDNLKLYLGMDLFTDISVLANVAANPVPIDMDKAIDHGLGSRMELRQREIDIENSMFDMIRTKSQNEFRGDVNLSYGIIGDDEKLNQIFDNPTLNPQVSVSFSIPLFDWGEKKARIAAQEAAMKTNELSLSDEKNQIIIGIRQVYRNILNQLNQIDIAEQNEQIIDGIKDLDKRLKVLEGESKVEAQV